MPGVLCSSFLRGGQESRCNAVTHLGTEKGNKEEYINSSLDSVSYQVLGWRGGGGYCHWGMGAMGETFGGWVYSVIDGCVKNRGWGGGELGGGDAAQLFQLYRGEKPLLHTY